METVLRIIVSIFSLSFGVFVVSTILSITNKDIYNDPYSSVMSVSAIICVSILIGGLFTILWVGVSEVLELNQKPKLKRRK